MENIKHLQFMDFIVIAVYFSIVIIIGTYFTRYVRQAKDYFTAGANIPWWLAAISFWMAIFSTLGFVTYSELGYKYGITTFTIYFVTIPGMIIGAHLFAGRWRRARQMSPIGFIEARFNPALRQVFVWTGFPLRMADNALRIYATAIFLRAAVSSDYFTMSRIIWLTGFITLAYSLFGGQWSVIVTDFVQFIILCLAVCMVLPLAIEDVNGLGTIFEKMPEGFTKILHTPYDLYFLLTWVILCFFSFNAGWTMIQKYNCVRNERDAKRVVYVVALWSIIGPLIFYTPSILAAVSMPELKEPRFAYAYISLKVLPVGLMGVMIAAIFSATLSTLSNEFNMLSSVMTNDFYARKINPDASQSHLINVGRINMLMIGLLTSLIAVGLQYIKGMTLLDIMVKAYTAFAPAIMAPLLGGILFRKLNSRGTLTGIISGFISGTVLLVLNVILVGIFQDQFLTNSHLNYWLNQGWSSSSILINFSVTIAGLWIGSVISETSDEEQKRVAAFFKQLETPYESETTVRIKSPFPIIGLVVTIMGIGMSVVAFAVKFMYHNSQWFLLNLISAIILLVLGITLWFFSRETTKEERIT